MGRQGAGPARPAQAQHRRCAGLATRRGQGGRTVEQGALALAQGAPGRAGAGHRGSAAHGAGAARGRRVAGPAHRGVVDQALGGRAGGLGCVARRCRALGATGRGIGIRCQLEQRRPEVSALAAGLACAAAGGLGSLPERAGAGRGRGRGRPGTLAAGAGMGRRTAQCARPAGAGGGTQAGQAQGRPGAAPTGRRGRGPGAGDARERNGTRPWQGQRGCGGGAAPGAQGARPCGQRRTGEPGPCRIGGGQ